MKKSLLLILLFWIALAASAQSFGFIIGKNERDVEIPFEIHNNFMVVNVTLNGRLPLKFIFDTGAEHTILSKNIFVDALDLSYDRLIPIMGADLNNTLVAYVSNEVHVKVGDAIAPRQDILILADDYFKIDEYVGLEIHGIIGADLFRNLVLKIDYRKNIIYLNKSRGFKAPQKRWKDIPISIEKNKPYLKAKAKIGDKMTDIKLLMDTGASLSLLLHTNTNEDIRIPENFVKGSIGRGLGGILAGYLGRFKRLEFGDYYFDNIITNYQDVSDSLNLESISNRNGIFGNALMRRFNIIIDYPAEKLYMQAHRRYNKDFKYDKSGLELIVSGGKLNKVTVYNIISNSPASEAGFQKGDQIISINNMPAKILGLKGVSKRLTRKSGKKVKIKLRRNGQTMIKRFRLKELI